MADRFDVEVDGATQLADAVKRLGQALPDATRAQFTDQARMIARDASGAVPRRSGVARATIDVKVLDGEAAIVAGGRRAPYFPWLEYGGRVGRHKSVNRPFVKDGRYIGRAVDAALSDIEAAAARAVVAAGDQAGLGVTASGA